MKHPSSGSRTSATGELARLERLAAEDAALISEQSLDRVLQRVVDLAAEVIGARYAAVGLLGADGRTLATFTTAGISSEEREQIGAPPHGRGVLGLVIHEGQTVRLGDLTMHPVRHGFPAHHPPMASFLGVPIIGKRGVVGDLYLTEKVGGGEFTPEDEHIAALLASKAGAVIENARLHEESARLLEEVQQLHRSRERFFAMVNHELRNSLAAVFGWAEMLVRRKDPATVPRAAFEVLDSAEQAISLINDLLDLSRLDEDRLKPVLREIDCGGVIRQALSRVTPSAEGKRVKLVADIPEAIPLCRTDPHRVEQILINVLGNAIRHTPPGSTVTVCLRNVPPNVEFQVQDQGPGVPAEEIERIFDVYQTKAGEEGKGSGLGLPLSRRLSRLLGGELLALVESGPGGRFILRLPAAEA